MANAAAFLDDDDLDTTELYAVLNIGRDASPEDVTRSYRKLAQVFHPDKHIDQSKHSQAQEAFGRIQEAYEVLSNPHKRQIYDVYGRKGLAAGLEVGDALRSREELRREWEEFRGREAREKAEAAVVQRGSYQAKVDLRPALAGKGLPGVTHPGTLFKSVSAQSSLEAAVDEHNVLSLSGQAAVRPVYRRTAAGVEELTIGGGNVVFGYKRVLSEDDVLDVSAQVGLQSLLSLTSTRRLDRQTGLDAWLSTSWGPQQGMGLQVGCSQNLAWGLTGSCNTVLGPEGATGVTTTLTKRGKGWSGQGRVEVGAVTGLQGRLSLVLAPGLTLRGIARLGSSGLDLELGVMRRFSPRMTGYVGGCVGIPTGVTVKVRLTRANQSFECPVMLSASPRDLKLALAAYVVPPLTSWLVLRFVVRPGLAWARAARERAQRAQVADQVRASLGKAKAEQALIAGASDRKRAIESGINGLVIHLAVYGQLAQWQAATATAASTTTTAATAGAQRGLSAQTTDSAQGGSAGTRPASHPEAESAGSQGPGPSGNQEAAQQSGEQQQQQQGQQQQQQQRQQGPGTMAAQGHSQGQQQQGGGQLPPAWLEVTGPLQYLVAGSQLVLAGGVPRSQLMGFADPAPGSEDKQLLVRYSFKGVMHEVVADDREELVLPPQHAASQ